VVAKVGDRIIVESQKVGTPRREGDILEVIEASYGIRYRVTWTDGHESTIRPSPGTTRTIPKAKNTIPKAKKRRK
jgi:hypothetical protein